MLHPSLFVRSASVGFSLIVAVEMEICTLGARTTRSLPAAGKTRLGESPDAILILRD
jgi:hypothetical protein